MSNEIRPNENSDNDENEGPKGLPRGLPMGGLPGAPGGIPGIGRPAVPPSRKEKDEEYFKDSFNDDSEEQGLAKFRSSEAGAFKYADKYAETEAKIRKRWDDLKKQYPAGGVKAFQILNYEILAGAPEDFFTRYETHVEKITGDVQTTLSEKGLSDLVGEAQDNPFDIEIQDKAFRAVQGLAAARMDNIPFKGIEKQIVFYMVIFDIMGLSRIEPLWRDPSINEIVCNGPFDVQVEIRGHWMSIPSCQFRDTGHIEQMLSRIFDTIGKTLSVSTPYLDGRLYDQSRIAATHTRIAPQGPNVAIRRHPEKYWTPLDLIDYNSASEEMFTEVGNWIYKGCSYIVIGGTSSGKTSVLNAMSGFFSPTERVLTLEDNLELKLHPGKKTGAPMEVVPPNANKLGDRGTTMRDLVRACLRLSPNGIVVGEVRDGAMYDLCQALNTGHWGCSSVHANSPEDGIYRMQSLVTQAELIGHDAALPLIAAAFDFIIMVEHFPQDGSRKITSVSEIDAFPTINEQGRYELGVNRLWEFEADPIDEEAEEIKITGKWVKRDNMSDIRTKRRHLNLTTPLTWEELKKIAEIPEHLRVVNKET